MPPGALLLRGQAGTASPYTPGGYISGFPRWPLHQTQAAAATPGQVRPNTTAAPPVALGGESLLAFFSNSRAMRWPPRAPPHCAAGRAKRRLARHRWRRCPSTPAPLPPEQPTGGIRGAAGLWCPPHPRNFTHPKTNIGNFPTELLPPKQSQKAIRLLGACLSGIKFEMKKWFLLATVIFFGHDVIVDSGFASVHDQSTEVVCHSCSCQNHIVAPVVSAPAENLSTDKRMVSSDPLFIGSVFDKSVFHPPKILA